MKIFIFFLLTFCDIYSVNLDSRFLKKSDPKAYRIANIPLRSSWWSRPTEYAWAGKFIEKDLVVLDAACGISHPFKWLLGLTCKETWACDIDKRINNIDHILFETLSDLGSIAHTELKKHKSIFPKVHLCHEDITKLPKEMPLFDRIFCISTLEHMKNEERLKALKEFANKLKPDGYLILTVDYPEIKPKELLQIALRANLIPAGQVETGLPYKGCITNGHLFVYCCVLKLGERKSS